VKPLDGPFRGTTHPPRYGAHKYWARKPANVLRRLVEHHTRPGALVLDPFCGSGVSIIEAALAGRRAVGFDVNPMAVHIARVTLGAVAAADVSAAMSAIEARLGRAFERAAAVDCPRCGAKASLRYRVWSSVAQCPACKTERVLGRPGEPSSRATLRCSCGTALPSTTVAHDELQSIAVDCRSCRPGTTLFPAEGTTPLARGGGRCITNGRIMAYEGLQVGNLFCAENWHDMQRLSRAVAAVDEPVRSALRVALTATAAQASRMIPFRGNLSTGGPAWTVPGFWVPRVHLQMNVWRTFRRRVDKLLRALADARRAGAGPHVLGALDDVMAERRRGCVERGDARRLPLPDGSVDYIVTDPPYGDSVPYLEFSQVWFPWLQERPRFQDEIVISDCRGRCKDLTAYRSDLATAFAEMARVLRPDGSVTCFFQNRSLDVWQALGEAALSAGLRLERVDVVAPAVVPAKSQLSRSGSLVGDVLLQFSKGARRRRRQGDWRAVARRAAIEHLTASGGESDLEPLAGAVLVALWQHELVDGVGDVAALLRDELTVLSDNRFGLPAGRQGR